HLVQGVHAVHAIGRRRRRAEQRNRDRRGVRRQDHVGLRDRVEAGEQRALRLHLLDDGFHDIVGLGQQVDGGGSREAPARRVAIGGGQLPLFDELREAFL